jgi:cytoskeleton protein RodZ
MSESDELFTELPLDSVGTRLKRARDTAGLSLADVSARTKIAERHLLSIETDNFGALASRAYVVGFARSYARVVGLDEKVIAEAVRNSLDGLGPSAASERHQIDSFELGDPARVPGARLAWLAAAVALAAILAGFVYWRSYYVPAQSLPELTSDPAPTPPQAVAAQAAVPQPVNGPVVFTALEPEIWVKFYNNTGQQLMQKQMALGETYTVPADAAGPMVWTGRPDALQITVGGQPVPKLAETEGRVKDVPVSAAALLARGATPAPQPAAQPAPAASPAPVPLPVGPVPASPAAAPVQ